MVEEHSLNNASAADNSFRSKRNHLFVWIKSDKFLLSVLLVAAAFTWIPRLSGTIDLRYDGGVYYTLGTAIAEGKGYKLLNEPGEINAVQYPPLLPLIIAGYQLILKTSDITVVGHWLRVSAILLFLCYAFAVFKLARKYFSAPYAFLSSLLSLFSLQVYFLSDLCFPEILFSLTTVLFVLYMRKEQGRPYAIGAFIFALASYALRTIGITALIVWFLESVVHKRFKQAAMRLVLILIPIMCWQFYIHSIETSTEYNHPTYSYQRAPYLFYNVTYSTNIALQDPFAPEKGKAYVVQRTIENALKLPIKIGESVSTPYSSIWVSQVVHLFSRSKQASEITSVLNLIMLSVFALLVIAGLIFQLIKGQIVVPLLTLACMSAICLTPFASQYLRYLMPILPFSVLSLIFSLFILKKVFVEKFFPRWQLASHLITLVPILFLLILQLGTGRLVYEEELKDVEYTDLKNRVTKQRLFYGVDPFNQFNHCIDYIINHKKSTDIVASGMPHWLFLRTGLKSIMPPFESNAKKAMGELESVPVAYLIIGKDVIASERYTLPVVKNFPSKWKKVFTAPDNQWMVFQRIQ